MSMSDPSGWGANALHVLSSIENNKEEIKDLRTMHGARLEKIEEKQHAFTAELKVLAYKVGGIIGILVFVGNHFLDILKFISGGK